MKKLLAAVLLAGLAFAACQKEFSIENGQSASLTGAWEFKDSANTLLAGNPTPNGYYIDDTSNTASARMVYTGAAANLSGSIFIEVLFPTGTATTGSYQSANGQVTFSYTFNNTIGKLYQVSGGSGQFSTENITVNITQITDTTVTGTFSGIALDSANRLVPIKEGKFSYRGRGTTTPPPATSVGTLGSAVDTCTGAVVAGTYRKNTALTGANTVTLTVNVTTAGTYSIASDTLKGISFKGTGSFATTGVQTVTLPGIGTPTDSAAALRFRVRYGTSNCTFLVKIDTAGGIIVVPPPVGDYFPTTANSNWSYDVLDETQSINDTIYTLSTGNSTPFLGNPYSIFTQNDGLFTDTFLYRKNAGSYYDGTILQEVFSVTTPAATQFLKDNVATGATWTESHPTDITGQNSTLRLDYSILAKAVPATVNSFPFTDVIKVKVILNVQILGVFVPYGSLESWYARGVGFIYSKTIDNTNPTGYTETKVRRYVVVP